MVLTPDHSWWLNYVHRAKKVRRASAVVTRRGG
jgi:hypothetical protein